MRPPDPTLLPAGDAGVAVEPGVGGGNGIGIDDAEMIERRAASCESRCSVGSIGSNGSRYAFGMLGLCCTRVEEDEGARLLPFARDVDVEWEDRHKLGIDSMITVDAESERAMG